MEDILKVISRTTVYSVIDKEIRSRFMGPSQQDSRKIIYYFPK